MSENIKKVMGPEEKLKELGIELPTPPPVDSMEPCFMQTGRKSCMGIRRRS